MVRTSSIVMKAIDAKTFSELQAFVKNLESRPTERLVRDVPDLVRLSESKVQIVAQASRPVGPALWSRTRIGAPPRRRRPSV